MSHNQKPVILRMDCNSCESTYKVTYKEDDVARNPIFCCCCGTEIDWDEPGDDPEDE